MSNILKDQQQIATREEQPGPDKRRSFSDSASWVCPQVISRNQLKEYLFFQHAGAELTEEIAAVREHVVTTDCKACDQRIVEIQAAEPFLRGEEENLPTATVKTVRPQPAEDPEQEIAVAEVSRLLVAALKTPTDSFSIEELFVMNSTIRTVSDMDKRKMMAKDVVAVCEGRWRRLRTEDQQSIESSAAKLMTLIAEYDAQSENDEADQQELGIADEKQASHFLLYMMTNTWFVNPEGEPTWDFDNTKLSQTEGVIRPIVVLIPVLRQALQPNSTFQPRTQPGLLRV